LAEASVEDLSNWLNLSKYTNIVQAVSITPCQIILIILFLEKAVFLEKAKKENRYLLITDEMIDICPELKKIEPSCLVNIDY